MQPEVDNAGLEAARAHVRRNAVAATLGRRCIDGRYLLSQGGGMLARPGADFGYLLALLAVNREKGLGLTADGCFEAVLAALTRRDRLDDVLAGIAAAAASGLRPLKLNAVAMRDVNDDELVDLVEFALAHDAELRFIEQMPLDAGHTWDRSRMVTRDEILAALSARWHLTPVPGRGGAPAERWMLDGGPQTVGVIASVTAPFCGDCDRLRLTADGQLRNCLFSTTEYDLLPILRAPGGGDDAQIDELLRSCVRGKLPGHAINDPAFLQPARGMNAIGG